MTEIPDEFTVVQSRWLGLWKYKCEVEKDGGQWWGKSTVRKGPFSTSYPHNPMEEEHAKHLYETYEVVDHA